MMYPKSLRNLVNAFSVATLCLLIPAVALAQSGKQEFKSETVVSGLENLWGMVFLPNGDMLVTERPGRLRVVKNGVLQDAPVSGTPVVHSKGQGCLLDIALHPDFATNKMVYFSYAKPVGDNSTTAIARGRFENNAIVGLQDIFVANSKGGGHYGSRLLFYNDGYLFFSVGDRQASPMKDRLTHPAQDITNHHGTINRIHDD